MSLCVKVYLTPTGTRKQLKERTPQTLKKMRGEKCLFSNTHGFLHNILVTCSKLTSDIHTFGRWVQKAYL